MIVPEEKSIIEFICKECGATKQREILLVGAIYGYLRIIAKFYPGEAARATVKYLNQIKTEVKPNEQEKASHT